MKTPNLVGAARAPRLRARRHSRWSERQSAGAALGIAALVLAGSACHYGRGHVVRVVDGQEIEGPFVSVEAYVAYARAAELEAKGRTEEALGAYEFLLQIDSGSVQPWTRIGALSCQSSWAEAEPAFREALELDASYEPLWVELARCHLRHGRLQAAEQAANRAVKLAPTDFDANILLVQALERAGRIRQASRWLRGFALQGGATVPVQRELVAFERRHGALLPRLTSSDQGSPETAGARAPGEDPKGEAPLQPLAAVDFHLSRSELAEARRHAAAAGLTHAEVALRAVALGRSDIALSQAWLVLGADPTNADAWIAALAAADLERDPGELERAVECLAPETTRPGRLGALLLAEVLLRREGPGAAASFLEGYGPLGPAEDGLERELSQRLAARLSAVSRK